MWAEHIINSISLTFLFLLKVESNKKRPNESATKTPGPDKKAKLVTPKKTGDFSGLFSIVLFAMKDQILAFSRLILKFCPLHCSIF